MNVPATPPHFITEFNKRAALARFPLPFHIENSGWTSGPDPAARLFIIPPALSLPLPLTPVSSLNLHIAAIQIAPLLLLTAGLSPSSA